jgi:glycerol uptake facilitator-like aquaporin
MTLVRRALAEGLGTAVLLAAVVGSGIMGEKLAQGNTAVALLANSIATGLVLFALIVAFAPRSGAHFNPVVTVLLALRREVARADIAPYLAAQFIGAVLGVLLAHAMFDLPLLQSSIRERASVGQWLSEIVATFGLVFVVLSTQRGARWAPPAAIGAYIAAAYWFTASTSFANPAVTLARGFTATFAGISPEHVAPFIGAQVLGAALGAFANHVLSAHGSRRT